MLLYSQGGIHALGSWKKGSTDTWQLGGPVCLCEKKNKKAGSQCAYQRGMIYNMHPPIQADLKKANLASALSRCCKLRGRMGVVHVILLLHVY